MPVLACLGHKGHIMFKLAFIFIPVFSVTACTAWAPLTQSESLVAEDTMARAKAASARVSASSQQKETFGVLAKFPGRTFKGVPTGSSSETLADFQHWAWADNGEALLIRHALEDGSYGGETIVRKDIATGELAYVYNTNAGFSTEGVFTVHEDGTWEAVEEVDGQGDITKVRSRGEILPSGKMISTSEYFSNGTWTLGHGFEYREVWQDLPQLQTPVKETD